MKNNFDVYQLGDDAFDRWLAEASAEDVKESLLREIRSGRPVYGVCVGGAHS